MKRYARRLLASGSLGIVACGIFAGCSTVPTPPAYTQEELKVLCERQDGWWRPNLLGGVRGYCEH